MVVGGSVGRKGQERGWIPDYGDRGGMSHAWGRGRHAVVLRREGM